MAERPILFSAPMVRAIMAGTKTQTRRVVSNAPGCDWVHDGMGRITSKHPKQWRFGLFVRRGIGTDFPELDIVPCPFGQPGDRLWVRETFVQGWPHNDHGCPDQFDADGNEKPMATWYRATDPGLTWCTDGENKERTPWRPSIHMPRAASRITLEITGVRVERLQAISEADALAEGVGDFLTGENSARSAFADLWESINGTGSWDANPWVWVVSFRRAAQAGEQHG